MANDKDFVVSKDVEIGKDSKVTIGTISNNAVDLSSGNFFTDTPAGAVTYTFNNPGAVQTFQMKLTGGSSAAITWPNSVKYEGGITPVAPGNGEIDTLTFTTDDGGTTYIGVLTGHNLS